jgi:hypothetical protein
MVKNYVTPCIKEYNILNEGVLCASPFDSTTDNVDREDFVW